MIREIIRKLNFFIKINKLTKELEFNGLKTKKNLKNVQERRPWCISLRLQKEGVIFIS